MGYFHSCWVWLTQLSVGRLGQQWEDEEVGEGKNRVGEREGKWANEKRWERARLTDTEREIVWFAKRRTEQNNGRERERKQNRRKDEVVHSEICSHEYFTAFRCKILEFCTLRGKIYFIGLIMPNFHRKSPLLPLVFTESRAESEVKQDVAVRQWEGLSQWSISTKSKWVCPYQSLHRLQWNKSVVQRLHF